jgi:hypothetical protein
LLDDHKVGVPDQPQTRLPAEFALPNAEVMVAYRDRPGQVDGVVLGEFQRAGLPGDEPKVDTASVEDHSNAIVELTTVVMHVPEHDRDRRAAA